MTNLFNQKTARHLFNYVNKGAGSPRTSRRPSTCRHDGQGTTTTLILASGWREHRRPLQDGRPLRDGTRAYFMVKFQF
ncbi:MAG: hypothetical protein R2708_25030 [Vicinamibacterales bacterium]